MTRFVDKISILLLVFVKYIILLFLIGHDVSAPNISSMAVRLAVRGDHPSLITSRCARLGGGLLAAADKTIGEKPVLDGVPDTVGEADNMEEDTDGVQGAGVGALPPAPGPGLSDSCPTTSSRLGTLSRSI